ncbi:hypothetical protein Dthio_PD0055 [Desulfonatronospira thiodismutans ASO3-1]|uniref:Hemolysin-type calcium-binding region n=1 Tax=Desulfonatronospira thiodismutans ASO3-1 TaxID=555779 RepID=D6SV08_9BACT|nr:hypothetical protein [Desulfonatronospira thiodismutans]EFI32764.1 hypothetical protein Dthio_PD0055 [Desulfonatronospira thiodismutans ASO3-1]
MEELPEEYKIDPAEAFDAGAVTVEDAGEAYAKVETILDGAQNADELELEDLFEWSIADTAENILDAKEEATVTGAASVGLADDEYASVEQAEALLELDNFDGVYNLSDSAENILAEEAQEVVAAAEEVSVTDAVTVADATALSELENFDGVYSLEDTIENLLTNKASEVLIINDAQEANVDGVATIAQIQDYQDRGYDNLNTYNLEDTAENYIEEGDSELVQGAESYAVSEPMTVAEYNDMVDEGFEDFEYELADTLDNLVAAEEGVVGDAGEYNLTDEADAFEALPAAEAMDADMFAVFDNATNRADYTYSLEDSLENLVGLDEGVVGNADSYTLTDDAAAFEGLTVEDILSQEEADMLSGAANTDDYTYSLEDEADAFFSNGAVEEDLVDLLDDPDSITVTTATTQEQRDALDAINDNVDYEGGLEGKTFTLTEDDATLTQDFSNGVDPDDVFLTGANDTINAGTNLGDDVYIEDPSTDDNDQLNAVLGNDNPAPTLINIETIQIRSINDNAELDMVNIDGTNLVMINPASSRDLTFSNFDHTYSLTTRNLTRL